MGTLPLHLAIWALQFPSQLLNLPKVLRKYYLTVDLTAGLPFVWRHPQNQLVNNNDKVTFDCFANGSDSLTITWEKDRRSYTSDVTQVTPLSNGVSSSLTLNRAGVADNGKYRCRATNVDGNSTTSKEAELLSKLSHC